MKTIPSPPKSRRHLLKTSSLFPALAAGWLVCVAPVAKAQTDYTNTAWDGSRDWGGEDTWRQPGTPGGNLADTVSITDISGSLNLQLTSSSISIASFTRDSSNATFRLQPKSSAPATVNFDVGQFTANARLHLQANGKTFNLTFGNFTVNTGGAALYVGASGASHSKTRITVNGTTNMQGGELRFSDTDSTSLTDPRIQLGDVNFTGDATINLSYVATDNTSPYVQVIQMNSLSGDGSNGTVQVGADNVRAATLLISGTGTEEKIFGGVIRNGAAGSNVLTLVKNGANTQTLTGTNTYTGATTILDGVLRLGATGSIASTTLGFGVHNGGVSGQLDILNASYSFGGVMSLTLAGVTTTSGSWDLFTGDGFDASTLTLSGVTSDIGAFTQAGSIWSVSDGQNLWSFDQATGTLSLAAIPEPGTVWLLTLTAGGMALCQARRRQAA